MDERLLRSIDAYMDEAPRASARVETVGPFDLFLGRWWPFYARPALAASAFKRRDVEAVLARQRALEVPEAFEWIDDLRPDVALAVRAADLEAAEHPLMYLDALMPPRVPDGFAVSLLGPADDLAPPRAVAEVGFAHPGTAAGAASHDEAAAEAGKPLDMSMDAFVCGEMSAGRTLVAVACAETADPPPLPVAVGTAVIRDDVAELVGIATLPAFRRKGIASALTSALARGTLKLGCPTVFLTSDDEIVARIYERVGFSRIGTACSAERPVSGAAERPTPAEA